MNKAGILSTKRARSHNYSKPGTYHLYFETHGCEELLGRFDKGIMTLNVFGELFLTALSLALHRFGGVRVQSMDIRPHVVEMVVDLHGWRLRLQQVIDKLNSLKILEPARRWLRFRRTQTIPLFMGYVKTNSARRINDARGGCGPVWKRRYKAAVLTDAEEIRRLCTALDARYEKVRVPVHQQSGTGPVLSIVPVLTSVVGVLTEVDSTERVRLLAPEQTLSTMLLGRALILRGRISDGDIAGAECGARGQCLNTGGFGADAPAARIMTVEVEGGDRSGSSSGG